MHLYFNLGNFSIPSYGLCILLGVISANLLAIYMIKKNKLDGNDFIILEAYTFLGGFIGAKALFLIVSRDLIEWARIFEFNYFNKLMQGGFVFYGGLILGLLFAFIAGKIHKINAVLYIRTFIYAIPWIHCFGRIGCYMAGCCYGIPYTGPGAVIFPKGSLAPSDISLFPVQLVEATGLMLIAIVILLFQIKINYKYTLETYLILYAILRFLLEYVRYDAIRGSFWMFSTSQWISIAFIIIAIALILWEKSNQNKIK